MTMQQRRKHNGWSMVELVVVISIMATFAAMAQPKFANAYARERTLMAAQRIAADIAYAQRMARFHSTGVTLAFTSTGNGTYSGYSLAGVASPLKTASTYTVDLTQSPYLANISSISGNSTSLAIDQYGQVATGCTIVVSVNSISNSIIVDASTGRCTVQ